jgi:hypothetical protein
VRELLTFPNKAKLLRKDKVVTPVMTKWQTVYLQRRPMQTGLLHVGYSTISLTQPQMPQLGGCMGLTANLFGLNADC